jgi:hypothetical protein
MAEGLEFEFLPGRTFLLFMLSILVVWSTQAPVQWTLVAFSLGVEWLWQAADHSLQLMLRLRIW